MLVYPWVTPTSFYGVFFPFKPDKVIDLRMYNVKIQQLLL